jgi:hypothetical protein
MKQRTRLPLAHTRALVAGLAIAIAPALHAAKPTGIESLEFSGVLVDNFAEEYYARNLNGNWLAKKRSEVCPKLTMNGHGGWRSPTPDELEWYLRKYGYKEAANEILQIFTLHGYTETTYRYSYCSVWPVAPGIHTPGAFYDCGRNNDVGVARGNRQVCVYGPVQREVPKPVEKPVAPADTSIVLKAGKDPEVERAKAEAERKKAEDDAIARDKAARQYAAQARANEEIKRLERDLKKRQECMKPEVRKQNLGCMCDRFFAPAPSDGKGTPTCRQ